MADEVAMPRGFGRRNVHCSNCGDERGGPVGHETAECLYRDGMSVGELVDLAHLAGRQPEVWEHYVDRYLTHQLAHGQPGTVVTVDALARFDLPKEVSGG